MKTIIYSIIVSLLFIKNVFADVMIRPSFTPSFSDFYGFFIIIIIGLYIFFTTKYPEEKDNKGEKDNKN